MGYEDIKTCKPQVFMIPNIAEKGPSLRYALYRLISDGLHRAMAIAAPKVSIGAYTRYFTWYSGKPYWMAQGFNVSYDDIQGVTRVVHEGRWAWFNQGQFHAWCCAFA
jgi:hypothetical protein